MKIMAKYAVYLGLGSNLGDRAENLRQGLRLLAEGGAQPQAVSRVYQTTPWGGVSQPDFYNLAALVGTDLPPPQLLQLAKAVERAVGRQPGPRWGARVLDIDILLYKELTFSAEGLKIPHVDMHRRAFVLIPLLELAPELEIPGRGGAAQLLAALPPEEKQGVVPVLDLPAWPDFKPLAVAASTEK